MRTEAKPLDEDDLEEVVYMVRTNEVESLPNYLVELTSKSWKSEGEILTQCTDQYSGNTVLHYCAANGHDSMRTTYLGDLCED